MVEQDATNYARFDVMSDGKSLRVFSATFADGSPTVRVRAKIASSPTTYLRLQREGDQWTGQYSYDGANWVAATSCSHSLAVSSVGVFSGNFTPNPPYTAVVDYFVETSAPLSGPQRDPAQVGRTAVAQTTHWRSTRCKPRRR